MRKSRLFEQSAFSHNLFQFHNGDTVFSLAKGTQAEPLDLSVSLEVGVDRGAEHTRALAVDDGDPLQTAEDGVVQESVDLQ